MLNVLCFLWRDPDFRHNKLYSYSEDHVNRLRNMLERHLLIDHRLVCVTDDPTGIDQRVDIIEMPEEVRSFGEYYPKLYAWHTDGWQLFGERVLLMDLDVVIVRDMTCLVLKMDPFIAWETARIPPDRRARFNSSFILYNGGAFPQIYERFDPKKSPLELDEAGFEHGDQGWVSYVLDNQGASIPKYGGGIESFTPLHGALPASARIVFFNGRSSPTMAKCQAVPWVRDNWR